MSQNGTPTIALPDPEVRPKVQHRQFTAEYKNLCLPIWENISMQSTPTLNKAVLLWIFLVSVVVVIIAWLDSPYHFDVDSQHYIEIAEGRIYNVIKPFSNRILHPIVAGTIAKVAHFSTELSFLTIGILALVVLLTAVFLVTKASSSRPTVIIAFLLTPFLVGLFQQYYLPDMFHAAILGLFFLCLGRNKLWWTLALLFLLYITRESTILLSLTVALISVYKRWWRTLLGIIIVTCLGITVSTYASSLGQPNIHATSDLVYMLGKIPYNFLKNIFGIVLWTNTMAANSPTTFPNTPLLTVAVPSWLPFGAIHNVGFYTFAPLYPFSTVNTLLTTFGALPVLVLLDLARFRRNMFNSHNASPIIMAALMYGLLSFFVGTSIGASVSRLVGYGWPAFWIASPLLLWQYHRCDNRFFLRFLSYHTTICWLPFLLAKIGVQKTPLVITSLYLALVLYGFAITEIRRTWVNTNEV